MEATNVVFYGTFIRTLNDYQELWELNGVQYAVTEEYGGPEFGTRYWATEMK